jgi:hypothetical protein
MADHSGFSDEAQRERALKRRVEARAKELSQDHELRAMVDEDNRRIALGLEPEGRLVTLDELKRLAGDTTIAL